MNYDPFLIRFDTETVLEPFDGGIETVELAYLAVAVRDIPDARLARPSAEELDRDHDLGILFQRL